MADIKDSGTRREFLSGAVRDVAEGKGRCDLLPLGTVAEITGDITLDYIDKYVRTGDKMHLVNAIKRFSTVYYGDLYTAMLEVSKHYEDGCTKYGERNWEKGISIHCYIDSAVRHYLKWLKGERDEPHDRAFLWNLLGAIWTQDNRPECCDLQIEAKTEKRRR